MVNFAKLSASKFGNAMVADLSGSVRFGTRSTKTSANIVNNALTSSNVSLFNFLFDNNNSAICLLLLLNMTFLKYNTNHK